GVYEDLQTVGEREEGIGGADGTGGAFGTGTLDGQLGRIDSVDLSHAHTDRGPALGEQNGVGLHGPAGLPGELEVGEDLRRRGLPGGQGPVLRPVALGLERVAVLDEESAGDGFHL